MSLFPLRRGRHSRRRRRAVIAAERLERRLAMSASTETEPAAWAVAGATMSAKAQVAAPASPVPIDAPRWVVRLAPGTDAAAAAAAAGAAVSTPTGLLPETFIWEFPATAAAAFGRSVTAAAAHELPHDVVSAYPLVTRQQAKKLVPNDPLFANQWHLRNTGQGGGTAGVDANVTSVWDTYLGTGVVIGIVDDGLQRTHADLAPNYVAAFSRDFNGNDADPTPLATDGHGTSAAGVAAARGNNATGVSGAAPRASLAGLRLIAAPTDDAQEATGLSWLPQDIDIYSNSWGPNDSGDQLEGPGPLTLAALEQGVRTGRGGLGSIYVWAAGNGLANNDNVNYDGYANSRYTIAVTAITNQGVQAWYAEPGAAILVAAPSSGGTRDISTTDLVGTSGYNTSTSANGGDYTDTFGGTSSATPLVSGVVALMLEANPALSWRDVQHVLVDSARRNDPTDSDWAQNGAGRWVNHKYGFGAIDAAAAVALAETWAPVGPEVKFSSGTQVVGRAIPDNNAVGVTSSFTVSSDISTEWVEVTFAATHPYRGDLEVVLTSPSGTSSVLAEPHADAGNNYTNWKFTSARNWGENSAGTWTLTVRDRSATDVGTWTSWSLDIYGDGYPMVDIASAAAEPLGIGGSSTITFAFSEAVTGFTAADVAVTGGTLSGFSGAGATYTATFTPQAAFAGNAQITVGAGTFTDGTGHANLTGASLSIAVDTIAPTLAIARGGVGTLKVGNTDTITFTLSEPVTNFVLADVSVTGGALSNFAGTGAVYTATFTPAADLRGLATISVAAAAFTDAAGNPNLAAGPLSIPVDTVAPTVTITRTGTGTLKVGSTDTITFNLSEPATDFASGDVAVTGGTLSGFTGFGTVYSAIFTPAAAFSGMATVTVATGTFTNASGNSNKAGSLGISVDTVPPTVTITRSGSGTIKIGDTPTITFTLNEASTDFAVGDVTVTGGTLSNFAGSGASYTAKFTPAAVFTGSAMLSVAVGAFTDLAGNPSATPGMLSIPIDTVAPTLSITRAGSGGLKIGDTETVIFTLSEPSMNFVAGDVSVTGGDLSNFTGSGTSYTATLAPSAGFAGMVVVTVAAGAFTDPAGNANATAGSLAIVVDAIAPVITGFTSLPTRATLTAGDSITVIAEFSERLSGSGVVTIELNSGATIQLTVDAGGLTARGTYTAQPGEFTDDLDVVAIVSGGSLRDAADNPLDLVVPAFDGSLAARCDIVIDAAVKLRDPGGGFSTTPTMIRDLGVRAQRIPLRFTTPVTGVTVAAFQLWVDGRAVSLQNARMEGSGAVYSLLLPLSRARPSGIYQLEIGPGSSIRATANGAAATAGSALYWGYGRSIGMVPDAPQSLIADRGGIVRGGTATLSWQPPAANAGGPILGYIVEYRIAGSARWARVRLPVLPTATPVATIQGLAIGRRYEFRVAARNAAGLGAFATVVPPFVI